LLRYASAHARDQAYCCFSAALVADLDENWPALQFSTGRNALAFGVMCLGCFIAFLDIQIVSASIQEIGGGLSASQDELSSVQTSYLIAEIIVIPLSGWRRAPGNPGRHAIGRRAADAGACPGLVGPAEASPTRRAVAGARAGHRRPQKPAPSTGLRGAPLRRAEHLPSSHARARTRARGTPVDRSGEPDIAADSAHSELGVPPKGS
jgi:hypothetical protein